VSPQQKQKMSSGARTGLIVGGVVAAALIVFIIATFSTGVTSVDHDAQYAEVAFSGTILPLSPEEGTDPAVGMPLPELIGQSFDGTPVSITNDGRPKVIFFLAHW